MSNAFDKASLVMLPHAYEEGKLYSLKPTDRSGDFTFSRGTDTATRVGEDGYIKKEIVNLLEQSNTFSDAVWTKSSTSVIGGQAGYDGSNNAWNLIPATNSTNSHRMYLDYSSSGGVFTASIYAKANGYDFLKINNSSGSVAFDVSTGNPTSGTIVLESGTPIGTNITRIENGWYRIDVAKDSPSGNLRIQFFVQIDAVNTAYAGDGTSGVLIQDAQLNPGLVAQSYLETTTAPVYGGLTDNMPRLDYTDASCPSLLLEPSRTNLITQSEYFGTGWNLIAGTSIQSNADTSPEGVDNATRVTSVDHNEGLEYRNISVTENTSYTFSWYGKVTSGSQTPKYSIRDASNNAVIDLGDWPVISNTEYKRQEISFTTPAGCTSLWVRVSFYSGAAVDYYIYGAQIEQGSYPTSYIPTYGSTQTRDEDNCHLINGASLPTTYPFTLYAEVPVVNGIAVDVVAFSNTLRNDEYYSLGYYNNRFSFALRPNRTLTEIVSSSIYGSGTHKVAVVVTDSSAELFVNGTSQAVTSTIDTFNSLINDVLIGQLRILQDLNRRNSVNQALVFPTALSYAECIALTQN